MSETHRDSQLDIVTEAERPALAPPPLHKVVMINDDFTPMGFVVEVL
jgi:ATP-dependent Clp protease adaptor protein ClpS